MCVHLFWYVLYCFVSVEIEYHTLIVLFRRHDNICWQYTTPKFGFKGQKLSPDDKFIESRVIGVEVACGPVDTTFVYITDDTITHGANIMIEVQRQGNTLKIIVFILSWFA